MSTLRKRTSGVWQYFVILGNKCARCDVCNETFSYQRGTSNLLRHLQRKHPDTDVTRLKRRKKRQEVESYDITLDSNIFEEFLELSSSPPEFPPDVSKLCMTIEQRERSKPPLQPVCVETKSPTVSTVTQRSSTQERMNATKKKVLDQLLVETMIDQYLPLSLVENEKFKRFIREVSISYRLPTCHTVSTDLMPVIYSTMKQRVLSELKNITGIAITIDNWTSETNRSYMNVMAHFISENCDMKCFSLECFSTENIFTAENLFLRLQSIFQEYGIEDSISAITTNNSDELVAATNMGNWLHYPCYIHSVSVVVEDALAKCLGNSLQVVRDTVLGFRRSSRALSALKSMQLQLGNAQAPELRMDIRGKWLTTLDMLKRFIASKEAIIKVVENANLDIRLPNNVIWISAKNSVSVLKKFKQLVSEFLKENDISISKVAPLSTVLVNYLASYRKDGGWYPSEFMNFVKCVEEGINRCETHIFESNELLKQAILLDPRFKKDGFESPDYLEQSQLRVVNRAVRAYPDCSSIQKNSELPAIKSEPPAADDEIWGAFDRKVSHLINPEVDPARASHAEMHNYMKAPLLKRTESALQWWKHNRALYPRLFQVAQTTLSVQAAVSPRKRGDVATKNRVSDEDCIAENLPALVFLKSNIYS